MLGSTSFLYFGRCLVETRVLCVRGTPWNAANRLHGQRTGALSWRPVLGLSRKTDQFRFDPTQNCAPGWWCDRESSVYHLTVEMYYGIFRHASKPLAVSCMLTKHQLHPCLHPTPHIHDYHGACGNSTTTTCVVTIFQRTFSILLSTSKRSYL